MFHILQLVMQLYQLMAFTIKDNDLKICLDRMMTFYQKMKLNDHKISTRSILKMMVFIYKVEQIDNTYMHNNVN